jgi:hypothetical protein
MLSLTKSVGLFGPTPTLFRVKVNKKCHVKEYSYYMVRVSKVALLITSKHIPGFYLGNEGSILLVMARGMR